MGLRYKIVEWAPEYRVGTDGSFWTRMVPGGGGRLEEKGKWHKLTGSVRPDTGYCRVTLKVNGVYKCYYLSHLILLVFRGPPPTSKHQAAHNNGNSRDNRLINLRWDTAKGNAADRVKHGTGYLARGEANGNSLLTETDVKDIRRRRKQGEKGRRLAAEYGVSAALICAVFKGDRWKHVTD